MKNELINRAIALFHNEKPVLQRTEEIRSQPEDHRLVVFAEYPVGKYVIKIASNSFTTAQRVNAWPALIAEYRKMGCCSPEMSLSRNGQYAEEFVSDGRRYVVWEEELAKLPFAEKLPASILNGPNGQPHYYEGLIRFMGKVAQRKLSGFPGKSGWVRLEPFGDDEETDETTECFQTFDWMVRQKAPSFVDRWQGIRFLYEENRKKLEKLYDRLPTSVFQGDGGEANLLLDNEGGFAGLIDYNLAGEDTALNMFISFCMFSGMYSRLSDEEVLAPDELPYLNRRTRERLIEQMLGTFRLLRMEYTFSEIEAEAAPLLFKYIMSVEYAQINALEKYSDDPAKLESLFGFMEYELRREDIDFRSAMLGD